MTKMKTWTTGVPFDDNARAQLQQTANMPFIHSHIAVMPDVHYGMGCSVGAVVPTIGAIIPACVGVDIGCGMMAVKTSLKAHELPDNLAALRMAIETAIPHGRTGKGKRRNDKGAWSDDIDSMVNSRWANELQSGFSSICEKAPSVIKSNNRYHLGTLGGGNHFIEVCLDENDCVWVMLHSGSRGVGNSIARHYIELAKEDMIKQDVQLSNVDLSYLTENTDNFNNYIEAVAWAQKYARISREIMMEKVIDVLNDELWDYFRVVKILGDSAINCHHNYIDFSFHTADGRDLYVTRKGAVSASRGELGIIPGSMGAKSFIVEGLGNKEAWHSCSHGAGRVMSRTQAKKEVSIEEFTKQVEGVECDLSESKIDETPSAYKNIDDVMKAQENLVQVKHTLKQILCVKG